MGHITARAITVIQAIQAKPFAVAVWAVDSACITAVRDTPSGLPIRPHGRTIKTKAITTNSATSVSLEKAMVKPPNSTVPMATHKAFTSAINNAAIKAPGMEPIPPTTTTTNASLMVTMSKPTCAGSRGNCKAPPQPANAQPSANTLVNK